MPGTLQDYAQAVHDVITINRDAEQGFRGAAHAVSDSALKEMFLGYAAQRARFAVEIQNAIRAMGFDPIDPQGAGGMLHASWISLKGMLTGHDAHAILVETERGEDSSLKTYRIALSRTLTPEIAAIMERQFEEIQVAHDRIRMLRDSTAPPDDREPEEPAQVVAPPKEDVPTGI
ncbi:MAG TPA: PA2169 family four-helix-bundle protein [Bryobacteraceae bacterium]|nr:PA2169 family four-helix-bundle protein [Bryobacteraceae bacterium]